MSLTFLGVSPCRSLQQMWDLYCFPWWKEKFLCGFDRFRWYGSPRAMFSIFSKQDAALQKDCQSFVYFSVSIVCDVKVIAAEIAQTLAWNSLQCLALFDRIFHDTLVECEGEVLSDVFDFKLLLKGKLDGLWAVILLLLGVDLYIPVPGVWRRLDLSNCTLWDTSFER